MRLYKKSPETTLHNRFTIQHMTATASPPSGPRRNPILASRIQILLILLPSFVSDVENPTAKNIKQNAKPETCTAMSVARKVMFRKYVRVLADSLKIHRNLILLIEAKLI